MHSVIPQILMLGTSPGFYCTLLIVAAFVGTASGMPTPALEGAALSFALAKLPGVLAQAPLAVQYSVTLVLLCWTISCVVMVVRFFFFTSNWWIGWHAPSFVQLSLDFKEMRRKRPGKP